MNPITGKPVIGKDLNKYLKDSRREQLSQIERTGEKFYNILREYHSSDRKEASKKFVAVRFGDISQKNRFQRTTSVDRSSTTNGKCLPILALGWNNLNSHNKLEIIRTLYFGNFILKTFNPKFFLFMFSNREDPPEVEDFNDL